MRAFILMARKIEKEQESEAQTENLVVLRRFVHWWFGYGS